MEPDNPRNPKFEFRKFFRDIDSVSRTRGLPGMWPYLKKLQEYLDQGLLRPGNAILSEDHKNYIIDMVIGLDERDEKKMFNRHFMNAGGCQTVEEWQLVDKYFNSYMDLLIEYLPLHRSSLVYSFQNDILYRGYAYYKQSSKKVVDHVTSANPQLKRVIDSKETPGEVLLFLIIDQWRNKGGFNVMMTVFEEKKPIGILFLKRLIRLMWMIKPFFDDQIRRDILPKIPGAAFRQLMNFDVKNLREVSLTDMTEIFEQIRLCFEGEAADVEVILLEHGFDFALFCLNADILNKRLMGVDWAKREMESYRRMAFGTERKRVMQQEPRYYLDVIKRKLLQTKFFDVLYNHAVMKKQIVEDSRVLVSWLVDEKSVDGAFLDKMFTAVRSLQSTDPEVADALLALLAQDCCAPYLVADLWVRVRALESKSSRCGALIGAVLSAAEKAADTSTRDAVEAWLWSQLDDEKSPNARWSIDVLAKAGPALGRRGSGLIASFLAKPSLEYFELLARLAVQSPQLFTDSGAVFRSALHLVRGGGDAAVAAPSSSSASSSSLDEGNRVRAVEILFTLWNSCQWHLAPSELQELWAACGDQSLLVQLAVLAHVEKPLARAALELIAVSPRSVSGIADRFTTFKSLYEAAGECDIRVRALWEVVLAGTLPESLEFFMRNQLEWNAALFWDRISAFSARPHVNLKRLLEVVRRVTLKTMASSSTTSAAAGSKKETTRNRRRKNKPTQELAVPQTLKDVPSLGPERTRMVTEVLQGGLISEEVPEEYRFVVIYLLFERYRWQNVNSWYGEVLDNPNLLPQLVVTALQYKPRPPASSAGAQQQAGGPPPSNMMNFDMFLAILEQNRESQEFSQLGWDILLDYLDASDPPAEWQWEEHLSKKGYQLLYSLELLDVGFIPGAGDGEADAARKMEWCRKFLRNDGFKRLLELLGEHVKAFVTVDKQKRTLCSTQCLIRILDIVYRFVQTPGVQFASLVGVPEQLHLSVSSENMVLQAGIEAIPEQMFQLVLTCIRDDNEDEDPSDSDSEEEDQSAAKDAAAKKEQARDENDYGSYALYLLVATLLKMPSLWSVLAEMKDFGAVLRAALWSPGPRSLQLARALLTLSSKQPSARKDLVQILVQKDLTTLSERTVNFAWLLAQLIQKSSISDLGESPKQMLERLLETAIKKRAPWSLGIAAALILLGITNSRVPEVFDVVLSEYLYGKAAVSNDAVRRDCFDFLVCSCASATTLLEKAIHFIGDRYMAELPATLAQDIQASFLAAQTSTSSLMRPPKYPGLRNLGNTCYMNATVQQLVNIPPLVQEILAAQSRLPKKAAATADASDAPAAAPTNSDSGTPVLADVLRRVLADPSDELNRLIFPDAPEMSALQHGVYKGRALFDVLRELGWTRVSEGDAWTLPPTVLLDKWHPLLKELDAVAGQTKSIAAAKARQVDTRIMFEQFQLMLGNLVKGGTHFYDTSSFVSNCANRMGEPVNPLLQEDAFEFLQILEAKLEENLKDPNSKEDSVFDKLFGLREVELFQCRADKPHCKTVRPPLATNVQLGFAPTVEQALRHAYNPDWEVIAGSACDECQKAGQKVPMCKRMAIASTPDYLIVCLKRYDDNLQKIRSELKPQMTLDLSRFSAADPSGDLSRWQYALTGTIVHFGGTRDSGHYFSLAMKEDGKWWKFNDKIVTPFRHELTEDRIGGQCVILFYTRKALVDRRVQEHQVATSAAAAATAPLSLMSESMFYYERHAFGALQSLLGQMVAKQNATSEQLLFAAQLGYRVLFEILLVNPAVASSDLVSPLGGVVLALFGRAKGAREWLVTHLLLPQSARSLERGLLMRDEAAHRKLFADLVALCVVTNDGSESVRQGELLMERIVGMAEFSRQYSRNHAQYWELISQYAKEGGPRARAFLARGQFGALDGTLKLDFCSLVMDYFLGQYSKRMPPGFVRVPLGPANALNLVPMFDAWITVMRSVANPAGVPSSLSLDGSPHPIPVYVREMFIDLVFPDFLLDFIRLGYNPRATHEMMRHWCFLSQEVSRNWLKHAIGALQKALKDDARVHLCRNPVALMVEALSIEDEYAPMRLSRVLEGTSETPSLFSALYKEVPTYSARGVEKVMAALEPFAAALPGNTKLMSHLQERPKLLAHVISLLTEYCQRGEQQPMLKEAIAMQEKFTSATNKKK